MELPDGVFGVRWNEALVHQVVTSQMANQRRGTAHAKTRGEVRGGGKKPWRQKGTGRARHGSTRSPIWIGGGVTHGPRSDKDYTKKINKKMAKKALYTVLSAKARDGEIVVIDALDFPSGKTKEAGALVKNLKTRAGLTRFGGKRPAALVALPEKAEVVKRTMRNLPCVALAEARNLTACDALRYKYVLFSKDVVSVFR